VSSALHISFNQNTKIRWLVPTKQRNTDLVTKVPFQFIPQGDAFFVSAESDAIEMEEKQDFPIPVAGLTVAQAIEKLGWASATVYRRLKRFGYTTEGHGGPIIRLEDDPEVL